MKVSLSLRELEFMIWSCNQELVLDLDEHRHRLALRLRNKLERVADASRPRS